MMAKVPEPADYPIGPDGYPIIPYPIPKGEYWHAIAAKAMAARFANPEVRAKAQAARKLRDK